MNKPIRILGIERFDTVGKLTDEQTKEYICRVVQSLVEWTRRIRAQSANAAFA